MSLKKLGWNSYFTSEFLRLAEPTAEPARVAALDRDRFVVWTQSGECEAIASGRLRHHSEDWPVVGDWVALESGCRIACVLPRQTVFSRKQPGSATREQVIAANVDVLFVVSGLDGDFNPRRIERYLLLARESGAKPVVVLNKADVYRRRRSRRERVSAGFRRTRSRPQRPGRLGITGSRSPS